MANSDRRPERGFYCGSIPGEQIDCFPGVLMLRLLFAFLCAAAACMLVAVALRSAPGGVTSAQSTASSTPDPFLGQVTHTARDSFASDISANGRFVVFESNADAATLKPGQTVDQEGLIGLCKEQLGSAKTPKSVEFWAELPRSAVGKLLKKDVRAKFWGDQWRAV